MSKYRLYLTQLNLTNTILGLQSEFTLEKVWRESNVHWYQGHISKLGRKYTESDEETNYSKSLLQSKSEQIQNNSKNFDTHDR